MISIEKESLKNLFDVGFEAIFISKNGICVAQNTTAEDMFGYTSDEALGRAGTDWIAKKDHALMLKKSQSGDENPYEVLACTKRGKEFFVEVRAKMVELGGELFRVSSLIDISERKLAERNVKQEKMLLDVVFESVPDLFFLIEDSGVIIDYKARKSSDLYVSPDVFLGKKMQSVLPEKIGNKFHEHIIKASTNTEIVTFDYSLKTNGKERFFEARISPILKTQQLIIIVRDISEQKHSENQILNNEVKFRSIFESSAVAIVVTNQQHQIIEWNLGACNLFGYRVDEIKNMSLLTIIPERFHGQHKKGFNQAVNSKKLTKSNKTHEVFGVRKNGEEFPLALTLGSWYQGEEVFYSAIILDVTERKVAEKAILYQAHYDTLTKLANRFLSLDRLKQQLIEAKRNNDLVAVLFLDLDDFKKVNDSLGHEVGDKLLIESAQRLSNVIRKCDTVGRLGGDEFIVILPRLATALDAMPIVNNLLSQFRRPFKFDNRELFLTVSIGVAIYPDDAQSTSDLLRKSDSAMYHSKNEGRNTYSFYTNAMNDEVARRLLIEEQMHNALANSEFELVYQPQVDVFSKKVIGAEALLRWNNTSLGQISPVEFIPIAEATGLIESIGLFVLDKALNQLKQWQEQYNSIFIMAVNCSPRQFRDYEFSNKILKLTQQYQIEPKTLELEITEGLLMGGDSYITHSINTLSEAGISIALDDFGTGFSSLSYIQKYPFDIIKIDRSFIRSLLSNSKDKELVKATIAMSHALDLEVVAEGVETKEQFEVIKSLKCNYVQGYLFGKPMSSDDFSRLLEKQ